MFTRTTVTALAAALAFGLVGVAQGASAQTADTTSVTVHYGDLNLATKDGASEMLQRIKFAAQSICGAEPTDPFQDMSVYKPCVQGITDRAVSNLNNSTVAALNSRNEPQFASAR